MTRQTTTPSEATMSTDRVLTRLSLAGKKCEYFDEEQDDECNQRAIYTLVAPSALTRPIYLCEAHAEDQAFYLGAVYR